MSVGRPSVRVLLPVTLLLVLAAPSSAQGPSTEARSAPAAGTWGAEAGINRFNDAAVLRFLSPSWAVLVGGSVQSTNTAGTGSARVPGRTDVAIQAGLRKYHRTGLGIRPITGLGVNFGRVTGFSNSGGVYGEAGAAYLFNRHVGLGATGVASFSRDGDRNTVSVFGPRVFASVFF
jgi:hypothetical protein